MEERDQFICKKGLGKQDSFGECEKTSEAVSCGAPGEQKDWGAARQVAWVEWGRALNTRLKRLISSVGFRLLNGRVNFGVLVGSGEDDDELEREEP